jgi:hypothetical protein
MFKSKKVGERYLVLTLELASTRKELHV